MSRLLAFMVLCWSTAMPVVAIADNSDWPMYNHDVRGTRHNAAEWRLNLFNVGGLGVAWRVNTPGAVTGTPAVVDDYLYVGDWAGNFYALDADCGGNRWTAHALAPVSASALVNCDQVFFGDQGGFIYALDRYSGALRWQVRPNPHPRGGDLRVTDAGGGQDRGGDLLQRGAGGRRPRLSLLQLSRLGGDAGPARRAGGLADLVHLPRRRAPAAHPVPRSGARPPTTKIWTSSSSPPATTTASRPPRARTPSSRSIAAPAPSSGRTSASRTTSPTSASPGGRNIDAGIGDSPQVYRLPGGRKVIGAGSKNGVYWVLDAATGQLLHERRIQTGGSLGGLFSDSAVAYGVVFANGIDWAEPFNFETLPTGGLLTAFTGDTKNVLWQVTTPHSVNQSGVAVANAVVYFSSCNPGTGDRLGNDVGSLHALSAITGRTLANINLGDCALSGPAIGRRQDLRRHRQHAAVRHHPTRHRDGARTVEAQRVGCGRRTYASDRNRVAGHRSQGHGRPGGGEESQPLPAAVGEPALQQHPEPRARLGRSSLSRGALLEVGVGAGDAEGRTARSPPTARCSCRSCSTWPSSMAASVNTSPPPPSGR